MIPNNDERAVIKIKGGITNEINKADIGYK